MQLTNSYLDLGDTFFRAVAPLPVAAPKVLLWNQPLARELGISEALQQDSEAQASYFAGNRLLPGSIPVALAYAGHQFGQFSPQLGDGRAHLLGELASGRGAHRDLQLKGSGPTPFSRGGDGRCALGPAIREFIMSEAMAALGVPTTRSLAVVTTGEMVAREIPVPGAVVTRVAASHLRVGTFEYFYSQNRLDEVEKLCDYAIARHYPDLIPLRDGERYLAFLQAVFERQVTLVCHWMRVGFIHGVMNTDNTAISGETIDYGPCAMMGAYNPKTVYSSIDAMGRYRFGNQPGIAQWNMARLAECLLPLIDSDEKRAQQQAEALLADFGQSYQQEYLAMLGRKIGLTDVAAEDVSLISDLLDTLKSAGLDYTQTFDLLARSFDSIAIAGEMKTDLGSWFDRWQARLEQLGSDRGETAALMRSQNPLVIPRNHHVEAVIASCVETGSAEAAEQFLSVLRSPYEATELTARYQDIPADGDRYYQTFCGT